MLGSFVIGFGLAGCGGGGNESARRALRAAFSACVKGNCRPITAHIPAHAALSSRVARSRRVSYSSHARRRPLPARPHSFLNASSCSRGSASGSYSSHSESTVVYRSGGGPRAWRRKSAANECRATRSEGGTGSSREGRVREGCTAGCVAGGMGRRASEYRKRRAREISGGRGTARGASGGGSWGLASAPPGGSAAPLPALPSASVLRLTSSRQPHGPSPISSIVSSATGRHASESSRDASFSTSSADSGRYGSTRR
ncbi:hypothetical protein DFJ74DRAFT_675059 [Hyaloraphidium curvatum]|nr:hypothetical protein DFJ74DRAFT_675059 [Hyaloraphidium curvatum]